MLTEAVLGLDLSLTGTGAVVIPAYWQVGDWGSLKVLQAGYSLTKSSSEQSRLDRYLTIANAVVSLARAERVEHVGVEQYAFSQHMAFARSIAELGGIVKSSLYTQCSLVAEPVVASSARKTVFGKVPKKGAKKAVRKLLLDSGAPKEWTGDQCDAFVVAYCVWKNLQSA